MDIVQHLAKVHGCRSICYLGSSVETGHNKVRMDYFMRGLESLSLSADGAVYACDYSAEGIQAALGQILGKDPLPDAIVCYNDRIALTVCWQA